MVDMASRIQSASGGVRASQALELFFEGGAAAFWTAMAPRVDECAIVNALNYLEGQLSREAV